MKTNVGHLLEIIFDILMYYASIVLDKFFFKQTVVTFLLKKLKVTFG